MNPIRPAGPADAESIAALHVASWRNTYRGILRDDFLDGRAARVLNDLWRERLVEAPSAKQWVAILEERDELRAFACVLLDEDAGWGALLDNLHVAPAHKGRGLGRAMISAVAEWVIAERPASPVHLWVYERNAPARRFYERLGGVRVESARELALDGERVDSLRYAWSEPAELVRRAARPAESERSR